MRVRACACVHLCARVRACECVVCVLCVCVCLCLCVCVYFGSDDKKDVELPSGFHSSLGSVTHLGLPCSSGIVRIGLTLGVSALELLRYLHYSTKQTPPPPPPV